MASPSEYGRMAKEAAQEWSEDDAMTLAGAVAYYSVFSLAPVLVLLVAIAEFVYGARAARGEIAAQLEGFVGESGAQTIQSVLANASAGGAGVIATITSIALILIGATAVFAQLQMSLNRIWDVQSDPDAGLKGTLRQRLVGLAMIFGIGVLIVATVASSTFLSNLQAFVPDVPGSQWVWMVLNFAVSFGILMLAFALMFKYVPDAEIDWSDVWVGAALTALLFTVGKLALGFYFSHGSVGSAYGAASSVILLLAWIYYSTLIVFYGAEFTQVFARHTGREIEPSSHAIRISEGVGRGPGEARKT